jgi:hypothetical protein
MMPIRLETNRLQRKKLLRELPETAWVRQTFSGCFDFHPCAPKLALGTPDLRSFRKRNSRGAQLDKLERGWSNRDNTDRDEAKNPAIEMRRRGPE